MSDGFVRLVINLGCKGVVCMRDFGVEKELYNFFKFYIMGIFKFNEIFVVILVCRIFV